MNRFHLFWEFSPLWLLPVLCIAMALSWLYYRSDNQWSSSVKWSLFAIRTLLIFFVLGLLLNPLIRSFKQSIWPPVAVILVDNSQSVSMATSADSLRIFNGNLQKLKKNLSDAGMKVFISGLKGDLNPDSAISFDLKNTALDDALQNLENEFDNQNLTHVFVASDGIFNLGADPLQRSYPFQINTIRLGNPSVRKDLSIAQIKNNKVAFLGNTFPLQVQVKGRKLEGSPVQVSVSEGGKLIESKMGAISGNGLAEFAFELSASRKGIRQMQIEVKAVDGETTLLNNKRSTYIEVIDGKQKVLIAAACPHPDIKALRSALESLDQLEVTTIVGGKDEWKSGDYNLVILHQLPDKWGTYQTQVAQLLQGKTATLSFAGISSDFNRWRSAGSGWLQIDGFGNGMEEMTGKFNPDFQRFAFDEAWKKTIESLPPIASPVATFGFKNQSETIISQKLGNAVTPTPLLAVNLNASPKRGIFWGDGLWLWRMNDYAANQNFNAVDNLIQKTAQLLLSADKKQRLKVYLSQNELFADEQATFFAETYNQLFEPVVGQKIDLELIRQDGKTFKYSFFNAASNRSFITESLPEGTYSYKAKSVINGKTETDQGEFLVKTNALEAQELESNIGFLQNLALQNGGKSVGIAQMTSPDFLGSQVPKSRIEFTDWDDSLLNVFWVLALIMALATAEWTIRKVNGSL